MSISSSISKDLNVDFNIDRTESLIVSSTVCYIRGLWSFS